MLQTGTVLQGRFLIGQQLAQGGMGAVYLATDQKFGSCVAIKERAYEHAELAEAFEREARLLNTLHHPILPHVSDYFSDGSGHFLVMEYIEGEDLSEVLKRDGAFRLADVIRWAMELLDGLDYLHSQDPPVIHRDIKPGNLKLTSRGNIVLLDFGLAKETTGNTQGVRSVFGYSRRYSPLEQIEGVGTDVRSDIFSLGATLFHLMTGEAPIDVLARASAIISGRPDPLSSARDINPEVPPTISGILDRALALDREKRFSSAAEMRSALEIAVSDSVETVTPVADRNDHDAVLATVLASEPVAEDNDRSQAMLDHVAIPKARTVKHRKQTANVGTILQRPVVLAAILIVSLLALGYAGLRRLNTNEPRNAGIVPPAAEPSQLPAETETPQPQSAEPIQPDVADVKNREATTAPVDNGLQVSGTDVAEIKQPKKSVSIEKPRVLDEEDETPSPGPRRIQRREVRVAREDGRDGYVNPPRRIRRRYEPVYEPPASAIEMIFTGVPPRRHMRRVYPY